MDPPVHAAVNLRLHLWALDEELLSAFYFVILAHVKLILFGVRAFSPLVAHEERQYRAVVGYVSQSVRTLFPDWNPPRRLLFSDLCVRCGLNHPAFRQLPTSAPNLHLLRAGAACPHGCETSLPHLLVPFVRSY